MMKIFIEIFGSYLTLSACIWKICDALEKTASIEARSAISKFLKGGNLLKILINWGKAFSALFDNIFGEKHFTIRCFIRSVTLSLSFCLLILFIAVIIRPIEVVEVFRNHKLTEIITLSSCISLIINLFIDYLSLLQTRYVIGKISETKTVLVGLGLVVIDFLSKFFIFLGIWLLINWIQGYSLEMYLEKLKYSWIPLSISKKQLGGIWLYTNFFTSVWAWLMLFSLLMLKVGNLINIPLSVVIKSLDIDNKPFFSWGVILISTGFVLSLVISVCIIISNYLI